MATKFDLDLIEWQKVSAQLKALTAREAELRRQLFANAFPNAAVGTNTLPLGNDYELKGVKKFNYTLKESKDQETSGVLDQIEKIGNIGPILADRLVTWKPSLSLTEYKKLDEKNPEEKRIKDLIDSVLTVSDAMPTIEIKVPAAK